MKCKEIQSKYIPFIDDELSISELEEFLKHLRSCKNCREEYDIYYTMIMGMRYLESDSGKGEFNIDPEQKLKSAEDYLIRYRILYAEKVLIFIIICIGIIILI
ncbi:MAG: zf-HC2 domain-containing protein [Lachnospiraceae bacterium]|nr:zf-HC2 domain-containing protein [Lachnospiraceae bacterium]